MVDKIPFGVFKYLYSFCLYVTKIVLYDASFAFIGTQYQNRTLSQNFNGVTILEECNLGYRV